MAKDVLKKRQRPHVFSVKPRFCVALKPALIQVRCRTCGLSHSEYLGPRNRDERQAEMELLRWELQAAAAIISARNGPS